MLMIQGKKHDGPEKVEAKKFLFFLPQRIHKIVPSVGEVFN